MMRKLVFVLSAFAFLVPAQLPAQDTPPPNPAFEPLLSQTPLEIEGATVLTRDVQQEIYTGNNFQPIWSPDKVAELISLLSQAEAHGLDPADYHYGQVAAVPERWSSDASPGDVARFEILLNDSYLRYGYHRRFGKALASSLDPNINFRRENFRGKPISENLREILAAPTLTGLIDLVAPSSPFYRQLQQWLVVHLETRDRGGWPLVSPGDTLHPGDNDPRVGELRARLAASGDLGEATAADPNRFDETLEGAVKAFQARHLLAVDGVVGPATVRTLNVPVEFRIDQLRASLERLRWVSMETAETGVAVNIAQYRALYFRDGEIAWSTPVMVGKEYRQTPVFRGDIAYMEFNPTWTIPPGIMRKDTLPAIKRDPGYLASKNIEVIDSNGQVVDPYSVDWSQYRNSVPYTLRQTPGPHNALGVVKFIFPNEHFVFLHDTSHRELFSHPERAFSSGCIRVKDPMKLAELLLDDPDNYGPESLQAILDTKQTQRVHLKPKIPVVIVYLTAALDADGGVVFLKDVYKRDQKVLDALNGPFLVDIPD